MERSVTAILLAILSVLVLGCGQHVDDSNGPDHIADEAIGTLFSEMTEAYDSSNPYSVAGFFSAGGSLDATVWGGGVAYGAEEVKSLSRELWFIEGPLAEGSDVELAHQFVTSDGAIVWWYGYDPEGTGDWAQVYVFGAQGQITSRIYAEGSGWPTAEQERFEGLYQRYLQFWEDGDPGTTTPLYSDDAVIRDDIRGTVWSGREEIAAAASESPPIESGPWPHTFKYRSGGSIELIALIQTSDDCPQLEARRLIIDNDRVVDETRYVHVPSADRCRIDLGDGWWTTFTAPPPLEGLETGTVELGSETVALVNAERDHEDFTRWLFDRYAQAHMDLPAVAAVWFPPSPDCVGRSGLAIENDDRYEGRHTVVVCFDESEVVSENSESGWSARALNYALHELGHVWMLDHLTDATRDEFNNLASLTSWRGADVDWHERGVEHAATTIAWGLAGAIDARYMIPPEPSCDELTERFVLLTGVDPITICSPSGG